MNPSRIAVLLSISAFAGVVLYVRKRQENIKKKPFSVSASSSSLSRNETIRYGRQMILNGFGAEGQERVCGSSVLVIGAGGIASSVLVLLAGAGVGKIGIVDGDVVDVSNLHRQTIHTERRVSDLKVDSAKDAMMNLNSNIMVKTYPFFLTAENAMSIIKEYDLVIEATDSLASKYLANDACVLLQKPYICGAAQGFEGQLGLYLPGIACYRCMFPQPLGPQDRSNCSDNGVLGPVPNIIGTLQALQAIHYLSAPRESLGKYFYMFDGKDFNMMRIKFPSRKRERCIACGQSRTIKSLQDSHNFCVQNSLYETCVAESYVGVESLSWNEVESLRDSKSIFLDVRERVQYRIWSLENSINIPLKELEASSCADLVMSQISTDTVFVVCRRGVDSRAAVNLLRQILPSHVKLYNIKGGLERLSIAYPEHYLLY